MVKGNFLGNGVAECNVYVMRPLLKLLWDFLFLFFFVIFTSKSQFNYLFNVHLEKFTSKFK